MAVPSVVSIQSAATAGIALLGVSRMITLAIPMPEPLLASGTVLRSCFTRWCWTGGGELRLAVFGHADLKTGFQSGYDMAYAGSLTTEHEQKIAFLRSGTALTVLDGKPVSRASLMSVIEECNRRVHGVFSKGVSSAVTVTSLQVDPSELSRLAVHLVCEDPRLSLPRMGMQHLALDMNQHPELKPIDLGFFDFMLDVSAALMDFPDMPHGPQAERVAHQVFNSPGYACARKALKARL